MKRIPLAIGLLAAALLLCACGEMIPAPTITPVFVPAPSATPEPSTGVKSTPASPILVTPISIPISDYPAAVQKAAGSLSVKLGVGIDQIKVIGVEEVQWPNGCLGIQEPGILCTMVIVDGYRVTLEVKGTRYEYHTNLNGTAVEFSPNAGPLAGQPGGKNVPGSGDTVLTWNVVGGIAGLCENLKISMDGKASAYSCVGGGAALLGQADLSASEIEQLNQWIGQFKKFEVDTQDPATADSMSTQLVFNGNGSAEPQESDKDAIKTFAAGVFARISHGG